jgi:hypothetical protein
MWRTLLHSFGQPPIFISDNIRGNLQVKVVFLPPCHGHRQSFFVIANRDQPISALKNGKISETFAFTNTEK